MRLNKANFAGLTLPGQQSEMKAILAGTWPPLKPLPVFKYETADYRATIDFDKKRGEWVCRKISLPSNEVQELRGGLREVTLALPHGEAETSIEGAEQQEPEFERETSRRLQAIREWREKYQNGARYFELRDFLSERQRTELDDSLRLSLTARQLQFSPKNAAEVFEDLTVAGGRFAALIDLAKQKKENQGIAPQAQEEGSVPEAEPAIDHQESLGIKDIVENNNDAPVPNLEGAERCAGADEFLTLPIKDVSREQEQASLTERMAHTPTQSLDTETAEVVEADFPSDADEFPAVTIKDVFPEQEKNLAERMAHTAFQQFEMGTSEIGDVDSDSASLVEPLHEEERHSPVLTGSSAQGRASRSLVNRMAGTDRTEGLFSANRIEDSYSRFTALRISAFQVNVFAILFLFAVTSFTVGLTVGRGPLGQRLREPPKSLLAADAKPPALPDEADESSSRATTSPEASSDDSAGTNKQDDATPSEEKFEESTRGSEDSAEARPTDADISPRTEPEPSVKTEVNPVPSGAIAPVVPKVLPPAHSRLVRPSRTVGSIRTAPRSRAPYRLTSTIGAAPHETRPSTILVTVPDRGSQPFRVSFPNKTIAATSSLAMTSQLSVFVPAEPEPTVAHKSARLEAGELVSFGWPRYPRPGDRYRSAQTIRVRASIGQLGQVQDVKFLGGSFSLLPATTEAIRQWRYTPTLLDKRPVQAQQDITIEFRPPQYSARLSTQHPPHN